MTTNRRHLAREPGVIARFRKIHGEFGMGALLKTLLLLFGLMAMAVMGGVMFASFEAALIAFVGLALGALLRRQIAKRALLLPGAVRAGLLVYGLALFLGDRFGIDHAMKLVIITVTTVVLFDLQFWALSDPDVENLDKKPP